tara:strand:- start:6 stop:950 length:945 start_codon:yes stop_codon:yes gene_type:complete
MQETNRYKTINSSVDEIDLRELFHVLFQGKWIIVSLTAFISIVGVIYSLSLPNIYQSRALLVSVNSSNGISGALGSYAGLAGLAGISIPSGGEESNASQAIVKLSSLSFFEENILPNIFLPDLMALKSWDPKTNTLTYDGNIYNKGNDTWVRDSSNLSSKIPSAQESFRKFSGHLSISEDKKTGFITLTIKHQSPFIAKKWAELLIDQVNTFYREKDKSESEKSMSYLNDQISMTSLSEVKLVIAQLLQEETKKLTLIEANQSYVFDYIDPPAVMENKSEPSRAFICILSALIGGILSVVLVLLKHYGIREKLS